MNGNRILLGVTGGIAAYKSPELVRRLRERGAEVQVVMTAAAQQFITALSLQAVSGRPVRTAALRCSSREIVDGAHVGDVGSERGEGRADRGRVDTG